MILDKAKMAHEWAMKMLAHDTRYSGETDFTARAWDYADTMQAEEDKRVKQKAISDAESSNVFFEKLTDSRSLTKDEHGNCLHFHHEFGHKKCMDCGASLEEWQPDFSNTPKDAIAYKIVDGIVQYLHGTRSSDGTLCGGYLANDGWIKLEKRP